MLLPIRAWGDFLDPAIQGEYECGTLSETALGMP